MAYNCRDYNPNQPHLLAPALDEWRTRCHFACSHADFVDALDLKPFLCWFCGNGQGGAAIHPILPLGVLFHASSGGCHPVARVPGQSLAAWPSGAFRAIAAFHRKCLENIELVFFNVFPVRQARCEGRSRGRCSVTSRNADGVAGFCRAA